ncbi:MAG: GMP synthase (glutamine-hydrolysing) [Candidatus Tokpelaia sp. JSC161]|jgi:GMP synthase (glutamine-hydrolysing)|nr:MAG: GMP synthase (glutamine-hydrolysing) [Candidatus Tokpelaia sp. JSC161]
MSVIDIDTVLIIDFGSQLTRLIARHVRDAGIYSEIVPFQSAEDALVRIKPKGVILSGSPCSAFERESPRAPQKLFDLSIPVLGICYGEHIMCVQLGGRVEENGNREFGRAFLKVEANSPLFDGFWEKGFSYPVWMSHGDSVIALPKGFDVIGTSDRTHFAAIADEKRGFYGIQFHPEVHHTIHGVRLIQNFLYKIIGLKDRWTMANYQARAISMIREEVGEKSQVICGLSGGIDSAVVALLLHKAIGNRLTCILVDNGFMRKKEVEEVISIFSGTYDISLLHINASDLFMNALKGVTSPEKKRKIIGGLFIDVFEEEARKIGGADFLAQGTLYPDVIESVSFNGSPSVTIKSHHNVGGLPQRMNIKILEPLRELFKDEVRILARELGLSEYFIARHPFPGPGLAVRCPGLVTQEKLDILCEADAIYMDEICKAGIYKAIWQAFTVLLPVKTVGVMGDKRTYEYVCALRAVISVDGMTADFYHHDMDFLGRVATRIINEVSSINRVVYDVTSKPPGTIEWE